MGTDAPAGPAHVRPSATVEAGSELGSDTRIWELAQIREGAVLGERCIVGRGSYIGPGVRIGNDVKIQNYALVYEPAVVEDGAFIGPASVLTNDRYPRAVNPDGSLKGPSDWEPVGVTVRRGASIGARVVCVAPVTIGAWAMVAAGSTVVLDVPAFALAAGSPARRIGWVGRSGRRLEPAGEHGRWRCPHTGEMYSERPDGHLEMC